MFDKSLRETGAGYFDFFLLHNLGEERTRLFDDFGLWDFLHEKKEAGLIRNLGFSIHDKAAVLEEVLEAHPEVDFVQARIQQTGISTVAPDLDTNKYLIEKNGIFKEES